MSGKAIRETLTGLGVIASMVFVGMEIRQNTSAIQTNTSQSVYTQYMDAVGPAMESPELAELIVRADTAPGSLSLADSLRYDLYLDFELNVYEAVYTNVVQGTMELGMASGWLRGMSSWLCRPGGDEYWRAYAEMYEPIFQMAMDSVVANTDCPG
jgi:hypothetical protein